MNLGRFITISRYLLITIGCILLVLPPRIFPSFYDIRYMGIALLVEVAVLFFVPRYIKVPDHAPNAAIKNERVEQLEAFMAGLFLVNGLGDLGLYQLYRIGIEYDKFLHFFTPLLGVIIGSLLLEERFEIRPRRAMLAAIAVVLATGAIWEGFEFGADYYFHTHLHGVNGINISNDTGVDLMLDILGVSTGVALVSRRQKLLKVI